jgi:hypothetical protein
MREYRRVALLFAPARNAVIHITSSRDERHMGYAASELTPN